MNDSLVTSFASWYEPLVTLTASSGELGLFVLYIYYLLILLRDKRPVEGARQLGVLLREIEESMMETSIRDRMVVELRELMVTLQYGKVQQYRERLERILALLRVCMQQE
jgi:hypothetical protein